MSISQRWSVLGVSLTLAALMLILVLGGVSAAGGAWQPVDVYGGMVSQLAAANVSPTVIYARTGNPLLILLTWTGRGSGIWKSADGGATWQPTTTAVDEASGDFNTDLTAMAASADGQTIYATALPASWPLLPTIYSRIWRSSNGGDSWTSAVLSDTLVWGGLAILEGAGGRVVVGSALGMSSWPILYSDDGTTWMTATVNGPYTEITIYTVAEGDVVYAGGNAEVGSTLRPAVYTSTSGITWTLAFTDGTSTDDFVQIVADPSDANRAYALVGEGLYNTGEIYSTTNQGRHWQPITGQPPPGILGPGYASIAVDSQGRLYMADIAGRIYRSTDHGATLGLLGQTLNGTGVNTIAVDPNADGKLYFGGYLGSLFTTSPAGVYKTPASYQVGIASAVFDPSNSGLRAYAVNDVAGNSTDADTIYAATHSQGIIKSTDGGQTWDRASEGVANWTDVIAVHPSNAKIAYFAGGPIPAVFPPPSYGLYRTEDGIVWEQRDAGLPLGLSEPVLDLEIDPTTPNDLYAVVETSGPERGRIFSTTNSGQSWLAATQDVTTANAIAIHPTDPYTLYAATDATIISPTGDIDAIYKSTDHGANWVRLPAGVSCTLDVLVNPINPTEVYATGCRGVFVKSTDDGANWTSYPITPALNVDAFPAGIRPGKLAYDSEKNVIYAALGAYGLVASSDGGVTWHKVTGNGIPSMAALSLFYQPQSGALYVGGSAGLWRFDGVVRVFLPVVLRN